MWFRSLFAGPVSLFPSSVEALRKFVPKTLYDAVRREEADRRYVIQHLSRLVGVTEVEMLMRIGKRLRVPVETQVLPISLSALPEGVTIADMRRVGAIPRVDCDSVTGFVCIDPSLLETLLPRFNIARPELRLATWFSIARALDQSERKAREEIQHMQADRDRRMADTCLKVVRLMLKDVQSHGATATRISTQETNLTYSFSTLDGKTARGVLDNRIREPLISLLNKWLTEDDGRILVGDGIQGDNPGDSSLAVFVRGVDGGGVIELAWGRPADPSGDATVLEVPDMARDNESPIKQPEMSHVIPLFPGVRSENQRASFEDSAAYVLLVDDNPTFARVLGRFLERSGMVPMHISGGAQALAYLSDCISLPHLVVCDVHMPDMNGFEFLKRMRGVERLQGTPVIMLTSDNDVETELTLIKSGADVFLTKTDDPRILCAHAQRLISQRRAA